MGSNPQKTHSQWEAHPQRHDEKSKSLVKNLVFIQKKWIVIYFKNRVIKANDKALLCKIIQSYLFVNVVLIHFKSSCFVNKKNFLLNFL